MNRIIELLESVKDVIAFALLVTSIGLIIMAFAIATGNAGEVGTTVIGGRPSGCPWAFCGCGLRKYLGLEDKRLDLAWNWSRLFRHTGPSPGVAAVRRHHVMLLVEHVAGSTWLVRDYNGGRHLSYIHERDVRGYVFVDPSSKVSLQ
jgi:hypothetical protein